MRRSGVWSLDIAIDARPWWDSEQAVATGSAANTPEPGELVIAKPRL